MAESSKITVALISGSLRHASINSAIIRAAARSAENHPAVGRASILPIRDFPLFDEDVEKLGDPPAVATAKQYVACVDGVIMATPEYNGALSGVLKNAVDWLSRPWGNSSLTDKPVMTMSAAPGPGGGRMGQESLRQVLRELGARVVMHDILAVSGNSSMVDDEGELVDVETLAKIDLLISALVADCACQPALTADR